MLACAGGGGPGPAGGGDGGWAALHEPRPDPLEGAPRVALSAVHLLPSPPWDVADPLPDQVGVLELVAAELLRRPDVRFVERRRFTEAAERGRLGHRAPPGAPPAGTSPGAELFVTASWARTGDGAAALDVRLVDAATGDVAATRRLLGPADAGPVGVSRRAVVLLLDALDEAGRLPPWPDGHAVDTTATVPPEAIEAFWRGVRAEDRYDWEAARAAYEEAARIGGPSFEEPRAALRRTARLRAGGTLAGS